MRDPHYLSPLFINGEHIEACTINIYKETMINPEYNQYIKSRYKDDAVARLEPTKLWGKLLYRIRVIPHAKG